MEKESVDLEKVQGQDATSSGRAATFFRWLATMLRRLGSEVVI
jgi:hypothetical protein